MKWRTYVERITNQAVPFFSTGAAGRAQSSPSCCVERGLDTVASHLGASDRPLLPVTPLFPNTAYPSWGLYFHKEPSERIVDGVPIKARDRRGVGSWTLSSPTEEEPDPGGLELRGNLRQPGG